MTTFSEPDRFEHLGWRVSVEVTSVFGGNELSGFADVFQDNVLRCRIVLATPHDSAMLASRLRTKAIAYIEQCALRPAVPETSEGIGSGIAELWCLIYVSRGPTLVGNDLKDILETSRRSNPARNITGALCFLDGVYMQYLEGASAAVEYLYQCIEVDTRHHMPKVLHRQAIETRAFAEWSMGLLVWNDETRHIVRRHASAGDLDLYQVEAANAPAMFMKLTRAGGWTAV